jgi:hypothetical protein
VLIDGFPVTVEPLVPLNPGLHVYDVSVVGLATKVADDDEPIHNVCGVTVKLGKELTVTVVVALAEQPVTELVPITE